MFTSCLLYLREVFVGKNTQLARPQNSENKPTKDIIDALRMIIEHNGIPIRPQSIPGDLESRLSMIDGRLFTSLKVAAELTRFFITAAGLKFFKDSKCPEPLCLDDMCRRAPHPQADDMVYCQQEPGKIISLPISTLPRYAQDTLRIGFKVVVNFVKPNQETEALLCATRIGNPRGM